jgi:hypothetical protein
MFRINSSPERIAALLLVTAAISCGALQGAAPVRAGAPANGASEVHLTEFDVNDTATGSAPGTAGLLGGEYPDGQTDLTHGSGFPAGDSIGSSISAPAFAP